MNVSTMPGRKRIEEAAYFFDCLRSLGKISQTERLQAISSAIVTLADAATICNISAQELWFNYVSLGTLRMYNGDVPASDFIKVTILLQNVIAFYCEQEHMRRAYEQSYQGIVKELIQYGLKNNDDRHQAIQWLSKYFQMPEREAIHFESSMMALSRFFILHPINTIDTNYSITNNLNSSNEITNTNNIVIENNIDFKGFEHALHSLTEAVLRIQSPDSPQPPDEQESPSADGGYAPEAESHIKAWSAILPELKGAESAAAKLAIEKWRGKAHVEAYQAAIPDGCASNPKEYVSKARKKAEDVAKRFGLTMPCWRSEAQ